MSYDRTQHQSAEETNKSKRLSLTATVPPLQVPGYRIIRHLGSGAYGEVWAADDLKTGRKVAIKFFVGKSGTDIAQLAGEVEKLALLGADRYVVQLLNVDWEADPPYYVMDYLENGSLEERLIQNRGMPVGDALDLFKELSIGMMHMHNKGVFHCDLKPGNVMLDQEGKPRIADFGQSRLSTGDAPALGTLFFMAPEQADLKAAPDARWDVYGLGALLYCMLIGKPPYYSEKLVKQLEQVKDIETRLIQYREAIKRSPKPTEHRRMAGVDRQLADILDRCIAANPNHRFENISSLLVALSQREITRTRKPLMVLGLLGPMILIGLMSLFGWEAFRRSVNQTQVEITKKATESNVFASQLAARNASEQIREYFRVVNQLAADREFKEVFRAVVSDPAIEPLLVKLADPADNAVDSAPPGTPGSALVAARIELRDHPLRQKLQPFLEERLWNREEEFPESASWFVCDRFGNQIASAFREPNQTLGKNYAYRTYFTGFNSDLPTSQLSLTHLHRNLAPFNNELELEFDLFGEQAIDDPANPQDLLIHHLNQRQIIDHPHLSAAFRSEQSNSWKVAFSTPIMIDDQVVGIVAVTVDLGGFVDFANQENHYVMLIDDRPGENRGIILEHPLHQKVINEMGILPEELGRLIVDIQAAQESKFFVDPVGSTQIGLDYNRPSIVGISPVTLRNRAPSTSTQSIDSSELLEPEVQATGLVVMALENYANVAAPVDSLVAQWRVLALLASVGLLLVSVIMWLFVRKLLQESRERLERAFSPGSTEILSLPSRDPARASAKPTSTPVDTT